MIRFNYIIGSVHVSQLFITIQTVLIAVYTKTKTEESKMIIILFSEVFSKGAKKSMQGMFISYLMLTLMSSIDSISGNINEIQLLIFSTLD